MAHLVAAMIMMPTVALGQATFKDFRDTPASKLDVALLRANLSFKEVKDVLDQSAAENTHGFDRITARARYGERPDTILVVFTASTNAPSAMVFSCTHMLQIAKAMYTSNSDELFSAHFLEDGLPRAEVKRFASILAKHTIFRFHFSHPKPDGTVQYDKPCESRF